MLDPVHLSSDETRVLLQHKKKSYCELISVKAHAVLFFDKGYSCPQIADILFRSEKIVREWLQSFKKERKASLFPKTLGNQHA